MRLDHAIGSLTCKFGCYGKDRTCGVKCQQKLRGLKYNFATLLEGFCE